MVTRLSSPDNKTPRFARALGFSLLLLTSGFSSPSLADSVATAKNAPATQAPRNVSFRKDVRPILDTYCVFCHYGASAHGQLSLEGKSTIWMLTKRPSMLSQYPGVVPGKPDESFLIHKLEGAHPGTGLPMPTWIPLDKEQINLIRKWIAEGALDN